MSVWVLRGKRRSHKISAHWLNRLSGIVTPDFLHWFPLHSLKAMASIKWHIISCIAVTVMTEGLATYYVNINNMKQNPFRGCCGIQYFLIISFMIANEPYAWGIILHVRLNVWYFHLSLWQAYILIFYKHRYTCKYT